MHMALYHPGDSPEHTCLRVIDDGQVLMESAVAYGSVEAAREAAGQITAAMLEPLAIVDER